MGLLLEMLHNHLAQLAVKQSSGIGLYLQQIGSATGGDFQHKEL
jgi:hypothetical protein